MNKRRMVTIYTPHTVECFSFLYGKNKYMTLHIHMCASYFSDTCNVYVWLPELMEYDNIWSYPNWLTTLWKSWLKSYDIAHSIFVSDLIGFQHKIETAAHLHLTHLHILRCVIYFLIFDIVHWTLCWNFSKCPKWVCFFLVYVAYSFYFSCFLFALCFRFYSLLS